VGGLLSPSPKSSSRATLRITCVRALAAGTGRADTACAAVWTQIRAQWRGDLRYNTQKKG
jgi:hypothetical protein